MIRRIVLALAAAGVASGLAATAHADIAVALIGPITGQYASFGEQMKRGAEMAVADINAKGGVLGQKLRLEIGDDRCDPKEAVAVANQMASKGVKFVAGHYCSGSSIPASRVYNEEGIVQISPASTNPTLTEQKFSNVFRVCGRDDQQGTVAGQYMADKFKDKRVAIVHDKTAYGKGLADETKKAFNAKGGKEVLNETITAGEKDYSPLVSKLKQNRVDVVYLGGYHTEAGLIVRQMREQGMDTRLVAGDALVTNEYWSITGPAGQGTMMTFSPDPRRNPQAAPIVEKFRKAGYEPEGYTLYTYAAVEAWSLAAAKAGKTDGTAVSQALKGQQFTTVLGSIGFDAKGDVTAPGYVFYEWKDGKYDYAQ
ncbi:MAG: branched-chain amino acid ABC transporter substrate-binding protein [Rhodospirillales bacterium]